MFPPKNLRGLDLVGRLKERNTAGARGDEVYRHRVVGEATAPWRAVPISFKENVGTRYGSSLKSNRKVFFGGGGEIDRPIATRLAEEGRRSLAI